MKKILIALLILFVLGVIGAVGGGVALYMWATKDLPGFTKITDYRPPLVTTVYARDGQVLGYFYREKRFLVRLDEMPPHLAKAFLASEDSSFYEHEGIDLAAIARAFIKNVEAGSIKQGGSTITQQIIKRLLLTSEKSYERKIKEAILAYRLEHYLTKDEILTIYLNQIFLGARSYGVEAAARSYFGKHVGDLTLAESALLAGLPQAPSRYNPYRHPELARERQLYVLGNMMNLNWISREEYEAAKTEEIVLSAMPDPSWKTGAYYLEEVRRRLIDVFSQEKATEAGLVLDRYGEDAVYESGLHVYTSVDLKHQAAAEAAMQMGLKASTRRRGWKGPLRELKPSEYKTFLASDGAMPPGAVNGTMAVYADKGKWFAAPVNSTAIAARGDGAWDFAPEQSRWFQVVVRSVKEDGATVQIGDAIAWMGVQSMHWCREPDPSKATDEVHSVKDAREVVKPGDVVFASVDARQYAAMLGQGKGNKKPWDGKKGVPLQVAIEQMPEVQGGLVSIEPDSGDVVALVGGYSFETSQFNRATQAFRQPGSAFKPIVYSTAMDNGFTPASMVLDAPFVYTDFSTDTIWRPENFEGVFYGPTLLRTALAKSRNLCTIRVAQKLGIPKIVERAKLLGLEPEFPVNLSVALGSVAVTPINLCQAYTAFARGGSTVRPRIIREVRSAWGEPLLTNETVVSEGISPQTAYIMDSMLKEVVRDGTGWRARILKRPVAGKTGTTNDEQDAWFMGFTPYLLTGVYVGFDVVTPMGKWETGSRAASPIWVAYRREVEEDYPEQDFPEPPGIVHVRIDGETGQVAGPTSASSYFLPFKVGTQPTQMAGRPAERSQDTSTSGEELLKQVF